MRNCLAESAAEEQQQLTLGPFELLDLAQKEYVIPAVVIAPRRAPETRQAAGEARAEWPLLSGKVQQVVCPTAEVMSVLGLLHAGGKPDWSYKSHAIVRDEGL